MSKRQGMTTDALSRWTISIDASPRLAAALAARPYEDTDTDETTDGDRVRALLALLGALPYPDRGIVVDWLFAGRRITRRILTDHRIARRTALKVIAESGIEGLLLALQGPPDAPAVPARHIGKADPCGALCEALRRNHGEVLKQGRGAGDTPPRLGSVPPPFPAPRGETLVEVTD